VKPNNRLRSVLSRTAVSQVTERLWQEYEVFAGRDLSEFQVAYFFVDGVAERLHAGLSREAVLCAWGITDDGRKVLLHLAPGTKEDTASLGITGRTRGLIGPRCCLRIYARIRWSLSDIARILTEGGFVVTPFSCAGELTHSSRCRLPKGRPIIGVREAG